MKEEIHTEQSNYTNVWQSQKIITDVIQTWVTPTLTSLLTELVPFNISPLARRNPQLPRRNPVPNSSITSSKETLRKLCLVDAKNRCTSLEEQFKNLAVFHKYSFNSLNFSKNNLHKLSSTIKSKYCLSINFTTETRMFSSQCSSKTQYFSSFSALTTFKQLKPLLNMHTHIYPPSVFTVYAPSTKKGCKVYSYHSQLHGNPGSYIFQLTSKHRLYSKPQTGQIPLYYTQPGKDTATGPLRKNIKSPQH